MSFEIREENTVSCLVSHFFVTFSGKQRHVRLSPMNALDTENIETFRVLDSKNVIIKGCTLFCTGLVSHGTSTCLCVAIKRSIFVYELNRTRNRHRCMKEIVCPSQVQCIKIINEKLFVGYPSTFSIYSLRGEGPPIG